MRAITDFPWKAWGILYLITIEEQLEIAVLWEQENMLGCAITGK